MTDAQTIAARFGAGGEPDPHHCPCPSYMPAPLPPEWAYLEHKARFAPKGRRNKTNEALRAFVHDALRAGTAPTLTLKARHQ